MRQKVEFTLEAFAKAEYGCHEAFQQYQKAQDNLDIIKEHGKDYLAVIMTKLDKSEEKLSESKLERLARSSKEWDVYREGLAQATKEAGEARVRYFSYVRYFECIQSGLAYKRTELRSLG